MTSDILRTEKELRNLSKTPRTGLERRPSSSECVLLSQENPVYFPASTLRGSPCHSSSGRADTFFWLPKAHPCLHTHSSHTRIHALIHMNKKCKNATNPTSDSMEASKQGNNIPLLKGKYFQISSVFSLSEGSAGGDLETLLNLKGPPSYKSQL